MSINPLTGKVYGISFPEVLKILTCAINFYTHHLHHDQVTVRDTARLHIKLAKEGIGIRRIRSVVGGSMGGMQALEWTILCGDYVQSAVIIGCGHCHTAWQVNFEMAIFQ